MAFMNKILKHSLKYSFSPRLYFNWSIIFVIIIIIIIIINNNKNRYF